MVPPVSSPRCSLSPFSTKSNVAPLGADPDLPKPPHAAPTHYSRRPPPAKARHRPKLVAAPEPDALRRPEPEHAPPTVSLLLAVPLLPWSTPPTRRFLPVQELTKQGWKWHKFCLFSKICLIWFKISCSNLLYKFVYIVKSKSENVERLVSSVCDGLLFLLSVGLCMLIWLYPFKFYLRDGCLDKE
jgi:hypothetical protein